MMSRNQLQQDKDFGGARFYSAFAYWVKKVTDKKVGREELRREVVAPAFLYSPFLHTIEDWEAEYVKHPEWHGKSPTELFRDVEGGGTAFWRAFQEWVKKSTPDKAKRTELLSRFVKYRYRAYSHLNTIEDWRAEYDKHPEWVGKSSGEAYLDRISGLSAFYEAFGRWVRRVSTSRDQRTELRRQLFPDKRRSVKKSDIPIKETDNELRKLLVPVYE